MGVGNLGYPIIQKTLLEDVMHLSTSQLGESGNHQTKGRGDILFPVLEQLSPTATYQTLFIDSACSST
jgi:hypothetical protein